MRVLIRAFKLKMKEERCAVSCTIEANSIQQAIEKFKEKDKYKNMEFTRIETSIQYNPLFSNALLSEL